jgi:Subtilase family
MDTAHPDLAANVFTNPGESGGGIESNGLDDDGNGLVDDVQGWDCTAAGPGDNSPQDENGHGTQMAGLIGAVGNNGLGITGVCWEVSMVPVKVLGPSGGGTWSDVVEGIAYAKAIGAKVANLSFGAYGAVPDQVEAAFESADGILLTAAAGNGDLPENGPAGDDLDVVPFYPACLRDVGHLLTVSATDASDQPAAFANTGLSNVDLFAPGVNLRTTAPGNAYITESGTSHACALAAGVAALAFANASWEHDAPLFMRHILQQPVARPTGLKLKCLTDGRLRAYRSVRQAARLDRWEPISGGFGFVLQTRPDGSVVSWGHSEHGSLGTGVLVATEPSPVVLPGLGNIISELPSFMQTRKAG